MHGKSILPTTIVKTPIAKLTTSVVTSTTPVVAPTIEPATIPVAEAITTPVVELVATSKTVAEATKETKPESATTPIPVVIKPTDAVKPVIKPEAKDEPEVKTAPATPKSEDIISGEVIPLEKKNAKLYKIGIILFVVILIGTSGIFYMRTQTITITDQTEPSPSPSMKASLPPETNPSPTPKAVALEKEEITLEILNGTSTQGLAGKTADEFEALGYKVKEVGNADELESSQLHVKTEFADQLENLLDDVKDKLDITEITKEVDDLDTTAKIILGG